MTGCRVRRYTGRVKCLRSDRDLVLSQLKHLVAAMFRLDIAEPDTLASDELLMGGSLGVDSLDALEIALGVEEEFGIAIPEGNGSRLAFASIGGLADFICTVRGRGRVFRLLPPPLRMRETPHWVGALGRLGFPSTQPQPPGRGAPDNIRPIIPIIS